MLRPTVEIEGKRYVLVEESELRRMVSGKRTKAKRRATPPLPEPDDRGYVPGLEFIRATIARDITRERRSAGLTQGQLAKLAGVRQETICRLEKGLQSPTVRTIGKIERALQRAIRNRRRSS